MQFYRRNLPHLQRDYKPHFVTFVTKLRWKLPPWAREITLSSCCHDHQSRYELHVAVVMPDHVHLILTPLVDENRREINSLIDIMRNVKGASARAINQSLTRSGAVWQEESFDHVLRSSEGLDAKVDYVLHNPVREGLVSNWREYRWAWLRSELPTASMRKSAVRRPDLQQNTQSRTHSSGAAARHAQRCAALAALAGRRNASAPT